MAKQGEVTRCGGVDGPSPFNSLKTMKIALLGDIHANLPALEATLTDIEREGCDHILDTGDLVGYGPFPNEVIDLLRRHHIRSTLGNYDRRVFRFGEKPGKDRKLLAKDPLKYATIKWTRESLSPKNLDYLHALPSSQQPIFGGMRLLVVHGTIDSIKEGLRSDTPEARLEELSHQITGDIVVCGHSHDPFIRRVDSTWFVNTGSVGRSSDGDYRAAYILAEIANRKFRGEIRRVEYDLERLLIGLRHAGLPEEFAAMFQKGVHLSAVTGESLEFQECHGQA
ncbi:MAG: metallophosphoesterase family protein [Armatimonadetes bacterium]|nr:metallophosphoesterase family protein [Armatimonadota bacterium]